MENQLNLKSSESKSTNLFSILPQFILKLKKSNIVEVFSTYDLNTSVPSFDKFSIFPYFFQTLVCDLLIYTPNYIVIWTLLCL